MTLIHTATHIISGTVTIKLTSAQRSALECAGLELDDEMESVILAAWDGSNTLTFDNGNRGALLDALRERCNVEDGEALCNNDPLMKRYARGACTALSNLSFRILRAAEL